MNRLEPWVIEKVLRRHERDRHAQRPYLELPLPPPPRDEEMEEKEAEAEAERGVAIIDFSLK